jgi:hypothetical protein
MVATATAPLTPVADGPRSIADIAERLGRLPLEVRDDIATVAEAIASLMRLGMKVRVVPMVFVLAWPVLFFWLVRRAVLAVRLLARDDVNDAIALVAHHDFNNAWNADADAPIVDEQTRQLVLLRHAHAVLGTALVGPAVIVAGFVLVLVM